MNRSYIYRSIVMFLILIIFICISLSGYMYLNRESLQPSITTMEETELYPGTLALIDLKRDKGDVTFKISQFDYNNDQLLFLHQGVIESIYPDAVGEFHIRLFEGENSFVLQDSTNKAIGKFTLAYSPESAYQSNGNNQYASGIVALEDSEFLVGKEQTSLDFWFLNSSVIKEYPKTEWEKKQKAFEKSAADFVELMEDNRRGIPNDQMNHATVKQQLNLLVQRRSKGWCSNIAAATAAFGTDEQFLVRYLTSGTPRVDQITYGGHAFNEIYWPHLKKWQFVDLTNRILKVVDNKGNPLNALQFQRYIKSDDDNYNGLTFYVYDFSEHHFLPVYWRDLDEKVRRDLKFYYGNRQNIYYISTNSSLYIERTMIQKAIRSLYANDQFMYNTNDRLYLDWAEIKFFIHGILLGACILLLIVVGYYNLTRKNLRKNS